MINGQVLGMEHAVAVLTSVLVPEKNIASGESWFVTALGHIFIEGNHTGQGNFQIGGSNGDTFVNINNGHFATKDEFDGFLPMGYTQGQKGHGLVQCSRNRYSAN
jgi:hypothetical protein